MQSATDDIFPVFPGNTTVSRNRLCVVTPRKEYTIEMPTRLAKELLKACTGRRSLKEIYETLGREWDKDQLHQLVSELMKNQALADIREHGARMLEHVRNPSTFPIELSDERVNELVREARQRHHMTQGGGVCVTDVTHTTALLASRRSCRKFVDRLVPIDIINRLAFATYGETDSGNRTVPSAGALYPLVVHLVLNRASGQLLPGIYKVEYGPCGQLAYTCVSEQPIRAVRGFLDQLMVHVAHGVVIISGNQMYQAVKYGPRALLYTVLEAGHAAQNVHLAASDSGLGTVEIGGFVEVALMRTLQLDPGYQPLTTVLFGWPDTSSAEQDIEVEWSVPQQSIYQPDFSVAMARLTSGTTDEWAYGRDQNPTLAAIKARAEAREWAACSFVHDTTVMASAANLAGVINPQLVVGFHPEQYRMKDFPFVRFDRKAPLMWTEATEERTGLKAYVLSDLLYFPFDPGTPPYAYANSSGVAAHPSRKQAVETAVLELAERDAFMIAYFGGISHPQVRHASLPGEILQRIGDLEALGCTVSVVDISLDLAPVALVMVKQSEWHFVNVAAAARFDPVAAISHALMEVEASVLAYLEHGPAQPIAPHKVSMPNDHGALYEQKAYYERADFLAKGKVANTLQEFGNGAPRSLNRLESRVSELRSSLYTVDYSIPEDHGGNAGLHIVRAIIPELVPMTFGYRQEPAGMRRLYDVASRLRGRQMGYGDLVKFPHPFA